MKNTKKITIYGVILVGIIVALFFLHYSSRSTIQEQISDSISSTTDTTQADQSSQGSTSTLVAPTIDFNDPTILAEVQSIPKDPSVVHIRQVFNEYLSGDYGKTNDDVLNIPPSSYVDLVGGFDSFNKSLYQSRFIVVYAGADIAGGEEYDLLFLDYPQQIYTAWMFTEGTSTVTFREFWLNENYPANYGIDVLRLNPRFTTDPTLSS